jgi:hypothetical protein
VRGSTVFGCSQGLAGIEKNKICRLFRDRTPTYTPLKKIVFILRFQRTLSNLLGPSGTLRKMPRRQAGSMLNTTNSATQYYVLPAESTFMPLVDWLRVSVRSLVHSRREWRFELGQCILSDSRLFRSLPLHGRGVSVRSSHPLPAESVQ